MDGIDGIDGSAGRVLKADVPVLSIEWHVPDGELITALTQFNTIDNGSIKGIDKSIKGPVYFVPGQSACLFVENILSTATFCLGNKNTSR